MGLWVTIWDCAGVPEKGTTATPLYIKKDAGEYRNKEKKLYMGFVDMEKAFD